MENNTYRSPWLIQRMEFKKKPPSNPSFDQLLSMDYMGSAEFEFGALPTSLKRICKKVNSYQIQVFPLILNYEKQPLSIIYNVDFEVTTYLPFILQMMDNKIRLKESTYLDSQRTERWMGKPAGSFLRIEAWWDLENNVLFTFGKSKANKILSAIKTTKNNKKSEEKEGWF